MNAFHYRLCHLVPAHCSAYKQELFFPQWCIALRVHIRLRGEQLTRYAYAESNSAEPKSQNMKRAKGVLNNETAAVYYLSNNNGLFFSRFFFMLDRYLVLKQHPGNELHQSGY